jgi:hypothetical protein
LIEEVLANLYAGLANQRSEVYFRVISK